LNYLPVIHLELGLIALVNLVVRHLSSLIIDLILNKNQFYFGLFNQSFYLFARILLLDHHLEIQIISN